ncbi:uncharacterized protein SCHCODRAFT_02555194 [Schizophyllum commune H4-8]|uniref:Uncharacterized protein n=1 Tax=Schizophyllum commune (strain H4-8 / FGSC 9210) TaxID=578458 RepID=D8QJG2_SCHCM|nr:uncharacterized protein SCHCODRAFT_02555194 [Schizophyllum commune H4-8]KAI5886344.1 hypothetical protein SCHCODRAFT_02555194 [Schizophyllum commune H4-8]
MPVPRSHLLHSSDLIALHPTRPPTEAGAFLPTGARPLSVTDMLAGRSATHEPAPRSVTHIPAPPIRRQAILPVCPGQVIALRFSSWSPVHAALKKTGYDDSPDLHYAKGARPAIVLRCAMDELNEVVALTVLPIASFGRKKDKKHISWALQDYVLRARQADDQVDTTPNNSSLTFDGTVLINGLDCSTSWVIALPFDIIAAGADIWSIVPYYDSVINKNSSTTKKAFVSEATLRALIKFADKNRDTFIGELKKNPDFAESVRYEMYLSVLPPGHPIPPSRISLAPLKATHYHAGKLFTDSSSSSSSTSHIVAIPRDLSDTAPNDLDAASPPPGIPTFRPRRPLPPIPIIPKSDHPNQTTPTAQCVFPAPKSTSSVILKRQAPLVLGRPAFHAEDEYLVSSADMVSTAVDNEPTTPTKLSHAPLTPAPRTPPKRSSDTLLPSRPSKRRSDGWRSRRIERSPSPSPSPASRRVKEISTLASVSTTPRRETQLVSGLPRHTGTMLEAMERLHARDSMQRFHPGKSMEKIPMLVSHRPSALKARPLRTPPSESLRSIESDKRVDHPQLKIADIHPASSGTQSAPADELSQPAATSSTPEPEAPVITQTLAEACSSFAWAQSSFSASTTLYVARPSLTSTAKPSSTDEQNLQKRKSVSAPSENPTKRLRGAEEESARETTA